MLRIVNESFNMFEIVFGQISLVTYFKLRLIGASQQFRILTNSR